MTYRDYLKTDHWQKIRQAKILKKRGNICRLCAKKSAIDVHHRTYKKIGAERLKDLAPICRSCHTLIHSTHRQYPHLSLKQVFARLRNQIYGGVSWRKRYGLLLTN